MTDGISGEEKEEVVSDEEMKEAERIHNLFVKCLDKWIKKFGLTNWDINVVVESLNGDMGSTIASSVDRMALIKIDPDAIGCDADIEFTARHEILELILMPLNQCAQSRFVSEVEIDGSRHDIIRRFENFIQDECKSCN